MNCRRFDPKARFPWLSVHMCPSCLRACVMCVVCLSICLVGKPQRKLVVMYPCPGCREKVWHKLVEIRRKNSGYCMGLQTKRRLDSEHLFLHFTQRKESEWSWVMIYGHLVHTWQFSQKASNKEKDEKIEFIWKENKLCLGRDSVSKQWLKSHSIPIYFHKRNTCVAENVKKQSQLLKVYTERFLAGFMRWFAQNRALTILTSRQAGSSEQIIQESVFSPLCVPCVCFFVILLPKRVQGSPSPELVELASFRCQKHYFPQLMCGTTGFSPTSVQSIQKDCKET